MARATKGADFAAQLAAKRAKLGEGKRMTAEQGQKAAAKINAIIVQPTDGKVYLVDKNTQACLGFGFTLEDAFRVAGQIRGKGKSR